MRKSFYLFFGLLVFSCDADRTELPRPLNLEEPFQKLSASLNERIVLEVTLTRPVSGSPDSTYVNVKNVSGKTLTDIEFFLESCMKVDSDVSDCVPDYHFTLMSDSLKNDEMVTDKVKQFVNFGYSNRLYITIFKHNNDATFAIPSKYPYSVIQKVVTGPTDTVIYAGSAKTYVQADGSFFCRGTIFSEVNSKRSTLRLEGRVSRNNMVYAKDINQPSDAVPLLFLGTINNDEIVLESPIADNTTESFSILLK